MSAVGGEGTEDEKRIEAAVKAVEAGWSGLLTTDHQRRCVANAALAAADAVWEGSDLARALADALRLLIDADTAFFGDEPEGNYAALVVARSVLAAWDTRERNRD